MYGVQGKIQNNLSDLGRVNINIGKMLAQIKGKLDLLKRFLRDKRDEERAKFKGK